MTMKARDADLGEPFAAHEQTHVAIEEDLGRRGNELLRLAYQAHLDLRHERERLELDGKGKPDGTKVRARARQLSRYRRRSSTSARLHPSAGVRGASV